MYSIICFLFCSVISRRSWTLYWGSPSVAICSMHFQTSAVPNTSSRTASVTLSPDSVPTTSPMLISRMVFFPSLKAPYSLLSTKICHL